MKIVTRGEEVYQCDVCNRKIRVASNFAGLSVLPHCNITNNCLGTLHKVTKITDITSTPAITPEVTGLQDWLPRKLLYTHNQSILSDNWLIRHNLSNNPMFDVVVNIRDKLTPITPTIELVNNNTSLLKFDKPYIGIAQAISLSTITKNQSIEYSLPINDIIQISNDSGLITFATLSSANIVTLELSFSTVSGDIKKLKYNCKLPSINSPWVGTNLIYFNNKHYAVRSVDIIKNSTNSHWFTNGDISMSSQFVISNIFINDVLQPFEYDSIIILLANRPYKHPDKILNNLIYPNPTIFTSNLNSEVFSLNSGKITTNVENTHKIHPPIQIIN